MSFEALGLNQSLLRSLAKAGYDHPTPIQTAAIPYVLAERDVLGCAQTGTGKTAAFALPILHQLAASSSATDQRRQSSRPIRALVLAPTRELAAQIDNCFQKYGHATGLRSTVVFGGVSQGKQVQALRAGVDIVVATPGRLLDLVGQGCLTLRHLEVLVLDEADHMLDLGFLPDVRRILQLLPQDRQTLLFSATMPAEIRQLADAIMVDPVNIRVKVAEDAEPQIRQAVHFVSQADKPALLAQFLNTESTGSVLVFTRTKRGADGVVRKLAQRGINAEAIHGNKSQNARLRTLENFRSGRIRTLVATDIAARGIDIRGVGHVVNYDLPDVPETYVHRIGRTGRAGAKGNALSFCQADDFGALRDIEKLLRCALPVIGERPANLSSAPSSAPPRRSRSGRPAAAASRPGGPRGPRRKPQSTGSRRRSASKRPASAHHA